jgi:hypothetical protein
MPAKRPPPGLSKAGRKLWTSIAEEIDLDAGAAVILTMLVEAFDRRQQARDAITKDGAVFKDRFHQAKPSPWCAIERDSGLCVQRCYHALGLDLVPPES